MHKHILRILIVFFGLIIVLPAAAIDGNYAIPYAPGQDNTQSAGGTVPAGSTYGRKDMELPLSTLVGGVLVVLGAGSVLYWQMQSRRRRQSR